ncbi:MAG TPA: hypothetical protein VHA09_01995, partial [Nitrososphaera sp.]|nr:hypothetical protein [Nitrososphaera sp.]
HLYSGDVIVKALHHHRVETMGQVFQMYSRKIADSDLEILDDLIYAPCILQKRLQKKSDIRVTVVGERVFAAEIDSPDVGAYWDDWHRCSQQEITIRAMANKLPELLEDQCIRIVKALGLRYGAIDFIRNEIDNSLTFLEVNPTGDWIWIERRTNQEITRAVADLIESLI